MTKHLEIRSDEAYELAHELASKLHLDATDVVLRALRELHAREAAEMFSDDAIRARYEALRALARETSKHKLPGATSDHSDLYDEFGLPR